MTHIDGIGRVVVPVTDQDRALEFYLGTLGMEKRAEVPAAGGDRAGRPGRLARSPQPR